MPRVGTARRSQPNAQLAESSHTVPYDRPPVQARAQVETGVPFMLFKDACNRKSNQQNLGTIRCSNLCTEIVEYTSPEETAVCNLASIALPRFVRERGGSWDRVRVVGSLDAPSRSATNQPTALEFHKLKTGGVGGPLRKQVYTQELDMPDTREDVGPETAPAQQYNDVIASRGGMSECREPQSCTGGGGSCLCTR